MFYIGWGLWEKCKNNFLNFFKKGGAKMKVRVWNAKKSWEPIFFFQNLFLGLKCSIYVWDYGKNA